MKILGRIFFILAVFSIFTVLMVIVVHVSGANAPDFGGNPQFRPQENGTEFKPGGDENRPERGEVFGGGARWLSGVIKNVVVIVVLVTVIVWPKSLAKKKKKTVLVRTTNDKL